MASQGEREPGVVGMDEGVLESMAQDGNPEQEMLVVEEHELPQTDPEPEKGAAAAAESDTPPPQLRQNPSPAPSETATNRSDSASSGSAEINRVGEMLMRIMQGMKEEINGMNNKMEVNTSRMEKKMDGMNAKMNNKMDGMTQAMRGEMRQMGQCLQAGIMAMPRAATNELEGSAPAGEDRVIREKCWARRMEVTETVTVTEREKLIG